MTDVMSPPRVEPVRSRRRRFRRPEAFGIMAYVVVTVSAVACIVPFALMVVASLTDERELVTSGYSFFPTQFSTAAFEVLFTGGRLASSYFASVFITVVGTVLSLAITSALAWTIANQRNPLRRPLAIFVYFPMLFTGGLVPFYMLVTQYLELSDSLWAVILPLLVNPFNVLVMVSFFRQFPTEVIEAALIDGAREATIFFRLVLPLSKPVLATIGLFISLSYWNNWFMALLFISDDRKYPLQLLLQNMVASVEASQAFQGATMTDVPGYQLRMALTLLTIGPIILVYPFLQRYFVRGLTLGAIKG